MKLPPLPTCNYGRDTFRIGVVQRPTCDRFSDSRRGWSSRSASQKKSSQTDAARRTTLPYVRQPRGRAMALAAGPTVLLGLERDFGFDSLPNY